MHFNPILHSIKNMSDYMIDIVDKTKTKATSLDIQEITIFNHLRVDLIKNNFENLIANLPSIIISIAHV